MLRIILAVLLILPASVFAAENAGSILKIEGSVTLYAQGQVRGNDVTSPKTPISIGDSLKTKKASQANVLFVDGSRVIVMENSLLSINGFDKHKVGAGTVLFDIKKRGAAKGLQVSTATATMGVKGTRFAVVSDGEKSGIFLQEGTLEIIANEGEFKRYRKAVEDEYREYEKQVVGGFEKYKEQLQKEFIEYVREFELVAGKAILIDGNEVRDVQIPDDVKSTLSLFDTAFADLGASTGAPVQQTPAVVTQPQNLNGKPAAEEPQQQPVQKPKPKRKPAPKSPEELDDPMFDSPLPGADNSLFNELDMN